jgi:hypothetical protein
VLPPPAYRCDGGWLLRGLVAREGRTPYVLPPLEPSDRNLVGAPPAPPLLLLDVVAAASLFAASNCSAAFLCAFRVATVYTRTMVSMGDLPP